MSKIHSYKTYKYLKMIPHKDLMATHTLNFVAKNKTRAKSIVEYAFTIQKHSFRPGKIKVLSLN